MRKLILLFVCSINMFCLESLYAAQAEVSVTLTKRTDTSILSRGLFRLVNSQGLPIDAHRLHGTHKISDSTDTPVETEDFDTSYYFSNTLTVYNVMPGQIHVAELNGCGQVFQFGDDICDWDMTFYTMPEPPPPHPQPEPIVDRVDDCGDSPIVIDLGGNWFLFTDVDHGVAFDIDADGIADDISWTENGSDDAFLALDRNGNGSIDNGSELFGNYTPQPESDQPNGYEALAVYDTAAWGGNGDGSISSADAVFAELLLWTDTNRNGASEQSELILLADSEIARIDLGYRSSYRRDRHGNEMRYLSKVYLSTGHWVWSTDVFFLVATE